MAALAGSSNMVDPNQQGVCSLPLPPMQYISLYTDENVEKKLAPPPPPIILDTYSMFGVRFNAEDAIIRPLESQGLHRLYPKNYDHRKELKKLNHSIIVNFLDLLDILIYSPEDPKRNEKIADLELLFIHMHHLVNEFRPHQARETLRVMLENQKRQRLECAERFMCHFMRAQEVISAALSALPSDAELANKELTKIQSKLEAVFSEPVAPPPQQQMLSPPPDDDDDDAVAANTCHPEDLLLCDIGDRLMEQETVQPDASMCL